MKVFHQRLVMVAVIALIIAIVAIARPESLKLVPYVTVPLLVAGLVLEASRARRS